MPLSYTHSCRINVTNGTPLANGFLQQGSTTWTSIWLLFRYYKQWRRYAVPDERLQLGNYGARQSSASMSTNVANRGRLERLPKDLAAAAADYWPGKRWRQALEAQSPINNQDQVYLQKEAKCWEVKQRQTAESFRNVTPTKSMCWSVKGNKEMRERKAKS